MHIIPRIKYRKGFRIYKKHQSKTLALETIESELRREAGFSDKEIDLFWNSTVELRVFYMATKRRRDEWLDDLPTVAFEVDPSI